MLVIVKVGKVSHIRLRRLEAYRAITVEELRVLTDKHKDAVVIIENVWASEVEDIRGFIGAYVNRVYFYVVDSDEVTIGLAQSLGKVVYTDMDRLYAVVVNGEQSDTEQSAANQSETEQSDTEQSDTNQPDQQADNQADQQETDTKAEQADQQSTGTKLDQQAGNQTEQQETDTKAEQADQQSTGNGHDQQAGNQADNHLNLYKSDKQSTGNEHDQQAGNQTEQQSNNQSGNQADNQLNFDKSEQQVTVAVAEQGEPKTKLINPVGQVGSLSGNDKQTSAEPKTAETKDSLSGKDTGEQTEPKVEPKTETKTSEPKTETKTAEPKTETKTAEHKTETKTAEPKTETKTAEPQTETKTDEPKDSLSGQGIVEQTEPKTSEPKAEPVKVEPKTSEPKVEPVKVEVKTDEPKVEQKELSNAQAEIDRLKAELNKSVETLNDYKKVIASKELEKAEVCRQLSVYQNSDVMEEPISLSEYKELKTKLESALSCGDKAREELLNQVSVYKQQVVDIEPKLASITSELEQKNKEYAELLTQSEGKDKEHTDLLGKHEELTNQLETLNSQLSDAEQRVLSLTTELEQKNNEIVELNSANKSKDTEIDALNKEGINKENQLTAANDRIGIESKSRVYLVDTLSSAVLAIQDLREQLAERERTINEYSSQYDIWEQNHNSLSETIENLQAELAERDSLLASKEQEVLSIQSQVDARVNLAHNFSKSELDKCMQDINSLKLEVHEWKTKFDMVQSQLFAKETQYNTLVQSVGVNEDGISSLLENSKAMGEVNKALREQVVLLKEELDRANRDKLLAQQTSRNLEETTKSLRVSIKAMAGANSGMGTNSGIPQFHYSGRGMVIPVFGSGSYGVTTTAMSIGSKLAAQARVLYIDFDMVSPKADSWFKTSPLAKGLPDVDPSSSRNTGLGLFVDKQVQYFLNNANSLIFNVMQTKGGRIDYISGFYAKPDMVKLISADFASFLNYCGNSYAYVVIDFGRLGSSEINDQIIKVFSDIAFRSVVVTTSDKFEIRTFRMKLGEARINISNIAWLVNMCETTKLEDMAKKAISPASYSMIPFNSDMYGKKLDFTKGRLTKDRLALFMEQALFNQ